MSTSPTADSYRITHELLFLSAIIDFNCWPTVGFWYDFERPWEKPSAKQVKHLIG